jgi:hypothetical protein
MTSVRPSSWMRHTITLMPMCLHAPHQCGLIAYFFIIICNRYFCFELPCIWKKELKSSETWHRVSRLMIPDVSRTANPHNAGHQKASHSRLPGPSETSACSLRHCIPCTYVRKNTKHRKARYCCAVYPVGRKAAVSIATRYALDGPGI